VLLLRRERSILPELVRLGGTQVTARIRVRASRKD
jgi:hypothetical protein